MSPAPTSTTRFTLVALGGVAGALLRAGVSEAIPREAGSFPTAMLLTQAIGCGLAGLLTPFLLRRGPLWSLTFLTGALSSFTTFGLVTGEVLVLAPDHLVSAVIFLVACVLVGVAAAAGGLSLAMGEVPRPGTVARLPRRGRDGDAAGGDGDRHTRQASSDQAHRSSPVRERRGWRR